MLAFVKSTRAAPDGAVACHGSAHAPNTCVNLCIADCICVGLVLVLVCVTHAGCEEDKTGSA